MTVFDKQPIVYNTIESLLEWIEWDLYQQRIKLAQESNIEFDANTEHDELNKFLERKIEEDRLCFNIGGTKAEKTLIEFDFNFNEILNNVNNLNNINNILDDNLDSICTYKINCSRIKFNKNVYFSSTIFESEVNFSSSIFAFGANFLGATFRANANFSRTAFEGSANFSRSTFEREANFSTSTFIQDTNFLGGTFKSNTYFSSSTFEGEVNFSSLDFEGNTYFSSSTFGSNTNFSRGVFGGEVNFSSAIFEGNSYFSSSVFKDRSYFLMSVFNGSEADFSRSTFEKEFDFSDSIFVGNVNFSRGIFQNEAVFSGETFGGNVDFSGVACRERADFSNSIFGGNVDFSRIVCEADANFSAETFNAKVDFSNANFKRNVGFADSIFNGKVNFSSSDFEMLADFSRAIFENDVDFSSSLFDGETKFSDANFNQDTRFTRVRLNGTYIFNNIVLNPNTTYIKFSNINYDEKRKEFFDIRRKSKIQIVNTVIKGRIEFNNVKISEIDFKDSDVDSGIINRINFEANPANWQTASLLKHEALLRDNIIEALEYRKIEKNKHTIELCKNIIGTFKHHKMLSKNIQYIPELLSLIVSKLSNNHGQNWVQAVLFTIFSGLLCFSLAYIHVHNADLYNIHTIFTKGFVKDFCNFLIPVNIDLLRNVKENIAWQFYLFYLMGKISVSYGMVEVVQAFRKFSNKGN